MARGFNFPFHRHECKQLNLRGVTLSDSEGSLRFTPGHTADEACGSSRASVEVQSSSTSHFCGLAGGFVRENKGHPIIIL